MEEEKKKDNILIHKEKPYYTSEELRLYYQIAIDEATKQGNNAMAAHYKILLDYLDQRSAESDKLYQYIMDRNNKNKK